MMEFKLLHVSERGHRCTDISRYITIPQNDIKIDRRLNNGFQLQQCVAYTIMIENWEMWHIKQFREVLPNAVPAYKLPFM